MRRVLEACGRLGTRVGAHPSYPDREGFGRRRVELPDGALASSIAAQCSALAEAAREVGIPIRYLKLHGALYHDANTVQGLAIACLDAAMASLGQVAVIGPNAGALRDAAALRKAAYLVEGFADRGVAADGTLIPRGEPGALIDVPAECAAQARSLASQGVDTICVHGDGARALDTARAVAHALRAIRKP